MYIYIYISPRRDAPRKAGAESRKENTLKGSPPVSIDVNRFLVL